MKEILKITENLYIDLSTGECFASEDYVEPQNRVYLTSSQLVLMKHFSKKLDLICSFEELEMLLDNNLENPKPPVIKQQIYRIKKKLQCVNPDFDSEFARHI